MIRIALTGAIGSGKSFISNLFGFPVFDADKSVANIYKKNKKIYLKLKNKLPKYFRKFPISKKELIRAMNIGYPIIGINNRNLKTLSVDIDNTAQLVKKIEKNFTIIAESGIKKKEDILKYNNLNIYNFLIGETILKAKNKVNKINELLI